MLINKDIQDVNPRGTKVFNQHNLERKSSTWRLQSIECGKHNVKQSNGFFKGHFSILFKIDRTTKLKAKEH